MHIGYLVQQFPPEVGAGPARVVELARHWLAAGARVTVFTGMPNRPEGRIHAEYRGQFFTDEAYEGIRVLRSWLFASPRHGFLRTIANNTTFMLTSALRGAMRGSDIDVLIASSPPFFPHISGKVVSLLHRIPLVLEVRDLWPDYLVEMGILQSGSMASRALLNLERGLLQRADSVTVVTESFRRRIAGKGVPEDRIHVMPAGVDAASYYRSTEAPPLPELERRNAQEFLVGYLGNFGAGQALGTVLEAARILQDTAAPVRIVLVGDGPEREELEEICRSTDLTNVSIHPPIPKDRTRAFYANCDVCLVPLAPVAIFQETIPSKIFEIMACERPVIGSVAGEAERIIDESAGGWVVPPGDAAALGGAILTAAGTARTERERIGNRGRDYVLTHYSRSKVASRYLNVLESMMSSPRDTRSHHIG